MEPSSHGVPLRVEERPTVHGRFVSTSPAAGKKHKNRVSPKKNKNNLCFSSCGCVCKDKSSAHSRGLAPLSKLPLRAHALQLTSPTPPRHPRTWR